MSIWAALGFIALGAAISEAYNYRIWLKYKDGLRSGVSMRNWKEGVEEEEDGNPSVTASRASSLYTREPMAGRETRPLQRRTRADVKAVK